MWEHNLCSIATRNYELFDITFQDVLKVTQALPNLISNYLVPYPEWNHLDYLWGIDANTLVYPEILKNMETYRN